jgi:hypothetical protein
MKVAINGSLNWWTLVGFENMLKGPKIAFFDSKNYGTGLESILIELSLNNDMNSIRDFSNYYNDPGRAQFSLVMHTDLKTIIEPMLAFRFIADRMSKGLERGFKRRKIPNFDWNTFVFDLTTYVTEKTKTA